MDLSKLSIEELLNLQSRIPAEIEARKEQDRQQLLKQISELASKHGYSIADILGKQPSNSAPKTRRVATIKFRNPAEFSQTWTGRGRKPTWVKEWLEKGNSIESLKV